MFWVTNKNCFCKKKGIGFVALFFISLNLFSQQARVLHLKDVKTEVSIPYAKIDIQPRLYANESGFLSIPQNYSFDTVTITAWNYADTTVILSLLPKADTAILYLRPQAEELNEVLVNPKNSWLQNEIYCFERWQGGWIFMFRKDVVITDDKLDVQFKTPIPSLDRNASKDFFIDALNNLYLVSDDSVQQLYVTDSILYVYPPYSRQQFDFLIRPLMAETDRGRIKRQIKEEVYDVNYLMRETGTYFEFELKYPTLHNCGIVILNEFKKKDEVLYVSLDSSAYLAASNAYAKYVGAYINFWKKHEKDGVFDPLLKGAYGSALHSYKNLFAHFKQVYLLSYANKFLLFDPYSNRFVTLDENLKLVKKEPFDFTNCPREEYLYTDQATGKWWLQRRVRGLDQLESVRPGDPPESIILDPFVRNIRVHNNVVFYINERGQFRVKRIDNANN
jgi:hypothetical protein